MPVRMVGTTVAATCQQIGGGVVGVDDVCSGRKNHSGRRKGLAASRPWRPDEWIGGRGVKTVPSA